MTMQSFYYLAKANDTTHKSRSDFCRFTESLSLASDQELD